MKRFLLSFLFLAGAAIAQQTIVLTFAGSTKSELNYLETNSGWYNNLSVTSTSSLTSFSDQLKYTDGSMSPISFSAAYVATGGATVTDFDGDDEELIDDIFGTAKINGVLSRDSAEILRLNNLAAGSYTLHVLAARGNVPIASNIQTTYSLSTKNNEVIDVTASVEAFCTAKGNEQPTVNNGATITAYTINTGNTKNLATNWVLMKFDIHLKNDITYLMLKASGNYGNVAGVVLTAIPEPAATLLSMCTLAILTARRRRK